MAMTARRRWVAGIALILLVASWHGIGLGVTPEGVPVRATAPARTPVPVALTSRPQGAGSCSATACHGSITPAAPDLFPSRVLRNEHTTWITTDRHANAYQTLFSRRSQSIARHLSVGKVPAQEDTRCLACHATSTDDLTGPAAEIVRRDGVGCESCHGASGRWLGAHTQSWWNTLSDSDKETQFGMRPTRPLGHRAAICVDCHVGGPGRDVNHDLIAAGHPRLNFEFAAYLANMPPHWVEDTRGNFPARAWAIGQVAAARAALDLLHTRAREGRNDRSPWPEFSEFDCFACHHDLADETWRKRRGGSGLTPGTPPWGTWYYPMMLALAARDRDPGVRDLESRFATLRAEMDRFAPEPGKVAEEAEQLSRTLARWLQILPDETRAYDAAKVKSLIGAVEATDAPTGWDAAAQRYLALQPLRLAILGLDPTWTDGPLRSELDRLFKTLHYPRGFDSPRRFDPAVSGGGRADELR